MVKKRLQLIEDNWPLFKVLFFEAGFQPELRQQIMQEIIFPMKKAIVPFFLRRMERGEIRRMNPFVAMQVIAGMMASFLFYKYVIGPLPGGYRLQEEQLLQEMLKIFYQGVGVHG
ncbi:MAG: TetR/AcrR family transcriptional regulator C-terminal domain-containing protein [Clostridia bacterium]|nr:TetR/AcrR family transcriptional regulator C-terminal domain-containing protein [Clostridia bacterium]